MSDKLRNNRVVICGINSYSTNKKAKIISQHLYSFKICISNLPKIPILVRLYNKKNVLK